MGAAHVTRLAGEGATVYAAGVVQLADAVETSEAEWDRTMAINAKGVFLGMKHVVPVMQRQAAATHGPAGIRVNSVHPGVVYTPMLETELSGLPASALEDFLAATPLRRGAAPDEVSGVVLFLVSDDSSFVSGAEIVVDGGLIAAR